MIYYENLEGKHFTTKQRIQVLLTHLFIPTMLLSLWLLDLLTFSGIKKKKKKPHQSNQYKIFYHFYLSLYNLFKFDHISRHRVYNLLPIYDHLLLYFIVRSNYDK